MFIILGSSGHLGSALSLFLLAAGERVHGIRRKNSFLPAKMINHPNFSEEYYDHSIPKIIEKKRPLVIVNCVVEYGRDNIFTDSFYEANRNIPLKYFNMINSYEDSMFIQIDSFFTKDFNRHSYLYNYRNYKKKLWTELKNTNKKCKLVNIRLEQVYGANESDTKFCKNVFNYFLNISNEDELIIKNPNYYRDFIFINDVCDFISFAYTKRKLIPPNTIYELGTGISSSILDFVQLVQQEAFKVTGVSKDFKLCDINLEETKEKFIEDENSYANTELINLLGWSPKYSLLEGINNVIKELYDK